MTDGSTALLIDAGISFKRLKERLKTQNMDIHDIDAIFITHEHSDHIAGLPMLCKHTGIPIYLRGGTCRALTRSGKCGMENMRIYAPEQELQFGGITVRSMDTPHDAAEPVCLRFDGENGSLALLTDLGMVPESVARFICGAKAVVLEFNHDVDMLRYGPYPTALKQRILGGNGHLNNAYAAGFARRLAEAGATQFLLAHLSAENNTAALAEKAFLSYVGTTVKMSVAPRDELSEVLTV